MALMPKKVKFRKSQRGSRAGAAQRGNEVSFGEFGMQSLGRDWITNNQIEACRIAINRYLKRRGKVWIRIFPHKPITRRPPETRMDKGKGAPDKWVAIVRPGTMMFEVARECQACSQRGAWPHAQLTQARQPLQTSWFQGGQWRPTYQVHLYPYPSVFQGDGE